MVSMPSIHFFRWTEQLKNSGHEVLWFDITGSENESKRLNWVTQYVKWKLKWDFPGRQFIKKNYSKIFTLTQKINERNIAKVYEQRLIEIQPDVVHSFVMYAACTPFFEVMSKYKNIKWIYSAWGNDLFFYQNDKMRLSAMKETLPVLDYMFADCDRDYHIAKKHGFEGEFLGVYPGGGGYDFLKYTKYLQPFTTRKKIIIKGYEHHFGRCNKVLEAVSSLKEELKDFEIIIFSASKAVIDFTVETKLNLWSNLTIYGQVTHEKVMELMGESKIYIGNSISDGMPNTLLEAICMEVFPIQSNPGGATEELISNGKNGLLIKNPEDVREISEHVLFAINNRIFLKDAVAYNNKFIKPNLEMNIIKEKVLDNYRLVETNIKRS